MREYAHHGIVDGVFGTVTDIRQICFLKQANYFLHESLFQSCHLKEQAHLLGVSDLHIGVHVGDCAVRNDERTRVSWVDGRSGGDECVLYLSKH